MANPIALIRLSIQPDTLNVYVRVLFIKIHNAYGRGGVSKRTRDADLRKEGRSDEVYVLAGIREETEHRKEGEGCHRAGIVVAGEAGGCAVEAGGDVWGC